MNWETAALIVVLGFVAMVSGGFWGLGGGWLILPSLFLIGIDVRIAVGACLLQMIPATIPTVLKQLPEIGWQKNGWGRMVALPLCVTCTVGALFGDPLGFFLEQLFQSRKFHQALYLALLGWVLYDIFKQNRENFASSAKPEFSSLKIRLTLIAGFITGVISGFLGIGGGTMTRPLMTSVLKVPEKTTGQIARLAILVTAAAGSMPYLFMSSSEIRMRMIFVGALLTAGGIAGFPIGAKMHSAVLKTGNDYLARKSFGIVVAMVMLGLICKLAELIRPGQIIIASSGIFILACLSWITLKSKMKKI